MSLVHPGTKTLISYFKDQNKEFSDDQAELRLYRAQALKIRALAEELTG